MKTEQTKNRILLGISILLLAVSLIRYKSDENKVLSSIFIAFSVLLFGNVIGRISNKFLWNKYFEEKRKMDIEIQDERNVMMKNKAGAQTNRLMLWLLSVCTLALGFMKIDIVYIIIPAILIVIQGIAYLFFYHRVEEKL